MSETDTLWVMSNRQDDRVVLYEKDPAHPGGEAFVGGSTPALVGRNGSVAGLLRQGLLVEVPEPKDGRKKPLPIESVAEGAPANQPGQAIKLGRDLDPELFSEAQAKTIEKAQDKAPDEIASTATVPPAPTGDKTTSRS